MSVDGPGILASDLGHDVYQEIISLYNSGTDVQEIRTRIKDYELALQDDMDREIYIAATAKAYWEIGHLDAPLAVSLAKLIESGTSLLLWRHAGGTSLERARRAVLNRLLLQIASPRKAPRPRKKPRQIKNKLFGLGDCLQLTVEGKSYRTVVCEIREIPGWCGYNVLLMSPNTGTTAEDYAASTYFGRLIPSFEGSLRGPHVTFLPHRDLIPDGNPFQNVGRVLLDPARYVPGTISVMGAVGGLAVHFDRIIARADAPEEFGDVLLPLRELILES